MLCLRHFVLGSEQRFESFRRSLLHSRDHVAVGVERELNAAVAKSFLHNLGVSPAASSSDAQLCLKS